MTTWDLEKLVCQLASRDEWNRRWIKKPLSESPFFLTLKHKDKKIFQDYYDILTDDTRPGGALNRNELTYEGFMDLYEDVKKDGIRDVSTIMIHKNHEHIIADGQHRLAILLHLGEKEITLPDASTAKTNTSGKKWKLPRKS